jgi:hypothetical protein
MKKNFLKLFHKNQMKRFLTVLSILLYCGFCSCVSLSYGSDYIKINYKKPSSKISKKIYNLQVESAKSFLKIAEITSENANLKLNKTIFEKSIFNNSKINSSYDKLLESKKEYIVKVDNGVKIAQKHLKEAKEGYNVLFEIIKNYIDFTDNANDFVNLIPQDAKNSFKAYSKDIDIKSYSERFFNDQIKATELLVEFYKYKAKHIVKQKDLKGIKFDEEFEKSLDLEFYKACSNLAQANVELAEAYALAARSGLVIFPEIASTLVIVNKNIVKKNNILTKAVKNLRKNKVRYPNCFFKIMPRLEKKYIKACEKDFSRIQKILKYNDNNKIVLYPESIAILKAKLNVLKMEIIVSNIILRQFKIFLDTIIV